ncbi:hydrophobic surface binding protein A-domain-containing protein [Apiospora arundinis]
MHFSKFAVASILAGYPCVSALPQSNSFQAEGAAPAGGAQDIIAKIGAVSDGLDGWAGAVNKYKIGYLSLAPADKAEKATEAAIDDATASVKKTKPLKDKENAAVAGQIATMLPKVQAVADALKQKAPVMIKEKVGGEVAADAAGVQNKMDELFASLQVVMTAQTQPGLRKAMIAVDKVMSQTQATFSGGKKADGITAQTTNDGVLASNQTGKALGGVPISDAVSCRQGGWRNTAIWTVAGWTVVAGLLAVA